MTISDSFPGFDDEPLPRAFHARSTRSARARPVLSRPDHRLRKRYAALLAAVLLPAIASAAEWPTAPEASATPVTAQPAIQRATYTPSAWSQPIHSDADDHSAAVDAIGGPAAEPFRSTGSEIDRARAEQCLTMAIYYEAATQPDDGQRAVAQVVLNRVAHPAFPHTVCGVVFQGSERSTGCQFSFACDGSLARRPMAFWWDRARRVARAALAGFVYAPVGLATHYHTLQVHPAWENSLIPVTVIGAHRFYRWPGAAGQKAAFQVAYLGGEPAAAPNPRALNPAAASYADPVALARAYDASLPAQAAPRGPPAARAPAATAYAADIQARGGDALFHANNLPSGGEPSTLLERSGLWLQRP